MYNNAYYNMELRRLPFMTAERSGIHKAMNHKKTTVCGHNFDHAARPCKGRTVQYQLDYSSRPARIIQMMRHVPICFQVFPGTLLPSTYVDPGNFETTQARSEIERRREYIDLLEAQIDHSYPDLVQLVKECLHNAPQKRPASCELFPRLQRIRMEVEVKDHYQSSLAKLEVMRQRLVLKAEGAPQVLFLPVACVSPIITIC